MQATSDLIDRFRADGRKITAQRLAVFRVLDGAQHHPTAEQIWEEIRADLPTVSLKTVYTTLAELVEMGEINQVDLSTGSARFDPNVESHHHLVCDRCGTVHDIHRRYPSVHLPDIDAHGFAVAVTEITFRGTCLECQRDGASS